MHLYEICPFGCNIDYFMTCTGQFSECPKHKPSNMNFLNDPNLGTGVDITLSGSELIAIEREDQVFKHNRPIVYDLKNNRNGELLMMVDALIHGMTPDNWDRALVDRMMTKTLQQRLVIAGALIAAEIDRLNLLAQVNRANGVPCENQCDKGNLPEGTCDCHNMGLI